MNHIQMVVCIFGDYVDIISVLSYHGLEARRVWNGKVFYGYDILPAVLFNAYLFFEVGLFKSARIPTDIKSKSYIVALRG